jgi:hypothetical protein
LRKSSVHTYLYTAEAPYVEVEVTYGSTGLVTWTHRYEYSDPLSSMPRVSEGLQAFIDTLIEEVKGFHMSYSSANGTVTFSSEATATVTLSEARLNTDYVAVVERSQLGLDYQITGKTLTSFVVEFSVPVTGDFNYLVFN